MHSRDERSEVHLLLCLRVTVLPRTNLFLDSTAQTRTSAASFLQTSPKGSILNKYNYMFVIIMLSLHVIHILCIVPSTCISHYNNQYFIFVFVIALLYVTIIQYNYNHYHHNYYIMIYELHNVYRGKLPWTFRFSTTSHQYCIPFKLCQHILSTIHSKTIWTPNV